MPSEQEHPALEALRARLDEEERAYSEVLTALDRLAGFPVPADEAPDVREKLARLNTLWETPPSPTPSWTGSSIMLTASLSRALLCVERRRRRLQLRPPRHDHPASVASLR